MKTSAGNVMQTLRNWRISILAIAVVLGLATYCSGAFAQSGAGSIQGTVEDSTHAVIPGATIHVVNQATGVTTNTTSNSVGFYQVPELFTGTYIVTITAPGMETYKATVELQVAQAATVNAVMPAGAVTQQVVVAGNVAQLTTTDNGTIASTLEHTRIDQLPMNGRILFTLTQMTTPGVEYSSLGQRVNGLMGEAIEYVADGAPLINRNFGGFNATSQAQLPDADAVQEVRVETTNTSAQYSEPATGIITTKSGTNGLHGSFFETARNNAWGIAKGRNDHFNLVAPHLVRNEFGASAGGPIVIPHFYHGKDKSFWFFAYERYSLAQKINESTTVPTVAMRNGDWSGLVNSSGVLQQLYDPNTTTSSANCNGTGTANLYCRAPFANNQVPTSRLAPTTNIFYHLIPSPSTADNPLVTTNLTIPNPTYQPIPTITFRLDHSFSETNKAYLRYTSNNMNLTALRNNGGNSPSSLAYDKFPAGASGIQDTSVANFASAIGYTHVFSPTFFAETILSQQWFQQFTGASSPDLDYEQMLGLPNNFGEHGFPGSNFGANLLTMLSTTIYQYAENQIISTIDENLTKTKGRHQLQFGGRYRHERFQYLPDRIADALSFYAEASALENPSSGASYTAMSNTGYTDADFYLGAASVYQINLEAPKIHFHDMEFDGYFQDNFHVSRHFIANIGLRYEAHPGPWTKYGLAEGFDLKNDAIVMPNPVSSYIASGYTNQGIITNLQNIGVKFETAQQAGFPTNMIENRDFTVSPRVGFAYQPFGGKNGTVIRGAYGRYIYPIPTRNYQKTEVTNPPTYNAYIQSYIAANQSPDSLPNYLLRAPQTASGPLTAGTPIMGYNTSNVVNTSSINSIIPGFTMVTINPNAAPDYVTQVNATIEQPFKGNSALRLSWVWAHGTNLDHYYYYNYHPSTYVWEINTGTAPPSGSVIGSNQYAATATGPYDQTTYGSNALIQKTGFSNDNALQINYQRLFHRGVAYQIMYVWSKAFRAGGNTFRDAVIDTAQAYPYASLGTMSPAYGPVVAPNLPPARPTGIAPYADWHGLEVFEAYMIDTAIPKQHIAFNGVVDLPFGRGKRFLGNANRFLDELTGGFQLAGDGNILSQDFQVASGNWGGNNPIVTYKHRTPITDCRSGVCHKAFEWFNGYLAPTVTTGLSNSACTSGKCVTGLPTSYQPYQVPIDNTPGTKYYGSNEVNVTLLNGTTSAQTYSPGPINANRYSKTFLNGPTNWTADLSLFKVFPITERVNLRFNMDAFNVFNVQGYNNPNTTDGTEAVEPNGVSSSYNTPRQMQLSLRLTF